MGDAQDAQVAFWIIAAIASVMVAILGTELGKNIIYFLYRRGRPPTRRPIHVWIIFLISLACSVIFGALAFRSGLATEAKTRAISTATPSGEIVVPAGGEIPTLTPTSQTNLKVKILDLPKVINLGSYEISVYDESDTSADQCEIMLSYEDDHNSRAISQVFGLLPKSALRVLIVIEEHLVFSLNPYFDSHGTHYDYFDVWVRCANGDSQHYETFLYFHIY